MIETEFLLLFYLTHKQQLPDDIKRRIFTFVPPSSWTSPSYYIMAQEIYHEWVTDPDDPRNNWLLDRRWVTPEDVANNPDSDSDSDDGDTTDVVGPMAPADATPGTTVAVEFNLRRGRGVRFFKGTVLRLNAATARVRFREFHNTYLDYDIAHARLFIPSPTAD